MFMLFDPIILLLYPREKPKHEESFKPKNLFMCHLYYEKTRNNVYVW